MKRVYPTQRLKGPDKDQSRPETRFDEHEALRLLTRTMAENRPCENCGGPRTPKDVQMNSKWCRKCRKLVQSHFHADAHGNRF